MPDSNNEFLRKRFDAARKTTRGPEHLVAEKKHLARMLKERIAAGESGDGIKKPDLVGTLKNVEGEIAMFEKWLEESGQRD